MKNYHFKVWQDFSRYVPIDETEYEKALYAFLKNKPVIFEMGMLSKIESITPDLNKMLGWYSDYKPNQEDNLYLEKAREKIKPFMTRIKEKIQYLIDTKQEHLIGKNIEIPELKNKQPNELTDGIKNLSEKFKI